MTPIHRLRMDLMLFIDAIVYTLSSSFWSAVSALSEVTLLARQIELERKSFSPPFPTRMRAPGPRRSHTLQHTFLIRYFCSHNLLLLVRQQTVIKCMCSIDDGMFGCGTE